MWNRQLNSGYSLTKIRFPDRFLNSNDKLRRIAEKALTLTIHKPDSRLCH